VNLQILLARQAGDSSVGFANLRMTALGLCFFDVAKRGRSPCDLISVKFHKREKTVAKQKKQKSKKQI